MAFSIAQFPAFPSFVSSPKLTRSFTAVVKPTAIFSKHALKFPKFASKNIPKASGEDEDSTTAGDGDEETPASDEMTELGKEIKQAMKEREGKEAGFMSGVAEEIREIEWPAFNKVLGTTGVVLGVIAGSSVVLLTVNAVLAEVSDTFFAGRGVQDFFG